MNLRIYLDNNSLAVHLKKSLPFQMKNRRHNKRTKNNFRSYYYIRQSLHQRGRSNDTVKFCTYKNYNHHKLRKKLIN